MAFNYTKEDLMAMPLQKLRLIDINSKEEEDLVQAVVRLKEVQNPPQTPVSTAFIPDIKTAEEEAKWQKILDDRRAGLKPQVEVKSDESGIEIKVEQAKTESKNIVMQVETGVYDTKLNNTPNLKCDCGFVAKSAFGLKSHSRKHKGQEIKTN